MTRGAHRGDSLGTAGRTGKTNRTHHAAGQLLGRPMPNLGTDTPCQDPRYDRDWWLLTPSAIVASKVARGAAAKSADAGQTSLAKANRAKQLCRTACPKVTECLAWAIAVREPENIWGGLDPDERRRVWSRKAGAA